MPEDTQGSGDSWGDWSDWEKKWNTRSGKYQEWRRRRQTGYGMDTGNPNRYDYQSRDWFEEDEGGGGGGDGAPGWPSIEFNMPPAPDYAAMYAQIQADAERAAGIRDMNALYGLRSQASTDALAFVESDINTKKGRANLMGVDYDISDEERDQRVSDYFASIWSEANEFRMKELMDQWGDPAGFSGFAVKRGTPNSFEPTPGDQISLARSSGIRPQQQNTLLEAIGTGGNELEEENVLLSI